MRKKRIKCARRRGPKSTNTIQLEHLMKAYIALLINASKKIRLLSQKETAKSHRPK